MVELLYQKGI